MAHITSHNWAGTLCVLCHADTGRPVVQFETVKDFRGEPRRILGGSAPAKPSSVGFIDIEGGRSVYAGVCNLKWLEAE